MDRDDARTRFASSHLYVVITERFCAGRGAEDVLGRVLDAGVTLVQLREKDATDRELLRRAEAFRRMTEAYGALLVVDDRVDVALACGADGVHLGLDDLPVAAARAVAPGLLVGASSHSLDEALAAQTAGADYVNIGPIFRTATKQLSIAELGVEAIDAIAPRLTVPWTVMGGIDAANVASVLDRGARHVAVVTAVTAADDVTAAARELEALVRAARH